MSLSRRKLIGFSLSALVPGFCRALGKSMCTVEFVYENKLGSLPPELSEAHRWRQMEEARQVDQTFIQSGSLKKITQRFELNRVVFSYHFRSLSDYDLWQKAIVSKSAFQRHKVSESIQFYERVIFS